MIPAQFDYVRPAALHEALQILVDREGDAKILAGGYSLLPLLKLRLASPALLVDTISGQRRLDEMVEYSSDGPRGGRGHPSPDPRGTCRKVLLPGCWWTPPAGSATPRFAIQMMSAHAEIRLDWVAVLRTLRTPRLPLHKNSAKLTRLPFAFSWIPSRRRSSRPSC